MIERKSPVGDAYMFAVTISRHINKINHLGIGI